MRSSTRKRAGLRRAGAAGRGAAPGCSLREGGGWWAQQERAAAQGIMAQTIVRKGQLRAEPIAVAKEIGATLIVMGRSLGPDAACEDAALQAFAAGLQAETGIEIRILEESD